MQTISIMAERHLQTHSVKPIREERISLDVNENIAAAKPKQKKKKQTDRLTSAKKLLPLSLKEKKRNQTGKKGYAKVERHIGNGGGTGGIYYADYDDYDDFM
ncbi:hypothetical protein PsorP6_000718 [Peronosclerospora sorghi]|uniref:Uncharacterized protein n=1 Tax=Peronosclerospora sorghi TaxID=230839 RepID=A0ACC0WVA0_9STRA|nr:hypothetical protein PsorP6_000718 [Peronosclerospora sorghi]